MATARPARSRAHRTSLTAAALTLVGSALLALLVPVASDAAPRPSLRQVQARVAALNERAEKLTERYDAARESLARVERERDVAARELAAGQEALARLRAGIGAQADIAYRNGGFDNTFATLVQAGSPQEFLDSLSLLDQVSRAQAEQLRQVAAAGHDVAAAASTVDARAAQARRTLADISADRRHIEALLAQARRLLGSLRAADRARLSAAGARDAASQSALRGSYSGPASGRAAVAVRFAYAQLGKPYRYGGAGPDSYDCSGLTMRAWGAAGVGLPHNAAGQQSATRAVGGLQPGDLVFFGSPAYHVGIYIGNGNMIAAPHTGDVVRIQSLSSMSGYSGAGRP